MLLRPNDIRRKCTRRNVTEPKKKHIQMRLNKVLIIQGMQEEDWKMSTMWSFMGEFKA